MTYTDRDRCPACGTAVPSWDVTTRLVECRGCRRQLDVTEQCHT